MRILYVGQLFVGSSALSRAEALRDLGHDVLCVEGSPSEGPLVRCVRTARRRTGVGPVHPVCKEIAGLAAQHKPDVVWIDKGLHVTRGVIVGVQDAGARAIHYSPDDARLRGNVSRDFLQALPHYDVVVTTKAHNLEYLRALGARRVVMSWKGYDPRTHRPVSPSDRDARVAGQVLFIGAWEESRARTIDAVAAAGVPVTVVSHWKEFAEIAQRRKTITWWPADRYGSEYAVLLGSAAVSLGFLRKQAGDLHTQRSIEIPAALLAEDHRSVGLGRISPCRLQAATGDVPVPIRPRG